MDFLQSFFNNDFSFESLFKFDDLSYSVQKHVQKVYATLAASCIACALGVYFSQWLMLHPTVLALFGFATIFGLFSTPSTHEKLTVRYAWMGAFAFNNGLLLGPPLMMILEVEPSLVMTALFLTLAVFTSFSGAALVAKRRSFLYLASFCSIGLSGLVVISLASMIFGRPVWAHVLDLYGGLILFSLYVLVDTQMIVERASEGMDDHVKSAMTLFLDALNIFIRILNILMEKKEKEDRRRKSK